MNKFASTLALVLLTAACAQTGTGNTGMMQGDMMKTCQEMMKDGQMNCCQNMMQNKSSMAMDMKQCQQMMQNQPASTSVSAEDHQKHHPAQ